MAMDIQLYDKDGKAVALLTSTKNTKAQYITDRHGRFQEANIQGSVFSSGMSLTSISNVTFTVATLGATCTPICGIWNPLTSGKIAVILQAKLQAIITALQATGAGSFQWATSYGNGALTLGNSPLNRSTFLSLGSSMKGLAGIALTGLTNNLVVQGASGLQGGANNNASLLGTAVGFMPPPMADVENIDGAFIVPPGGILALLCSTTPVAISAASDMMWEELPVSCMP